MSKSKLVPLASIVFAVSLALLGAGCADQEPPDEGAGSGGAATTTSGAGTGDGGYGAAPTTTAAAEGGGGAASEASLTAQGFAWEPTTLQLQQGEVTLTVENQDSAPHTFTSEELGVDENIAAGDTAEVTINATEAGSFDFVCTLHPDMTGTVEVSA